MGDENTKEELSQPGTSKKDDQERSAHRLCDDRNRDDAESYTESTESAAYSARGRAEYMAERRANTLKSPVLKQAKGTERKKRRRASGGRVEKRSRSHARRRVRRAPKKRAKPQHQRKYRAPSVSTIFTRMTSISGSTRSAGGSRTRGCEYCGHRCCRRRYEDELRSRQKTVRLRRQPRKVIADSETVQAGSRCAMLSPLFISTNSTPEDIMELAKTYCEVTPEMIYESLKRLTMWKQLVSFAAIVEDMTKYFPVNPDEQELVNELSDKLLIAAVAGFVVGEKKGGEDFWCLNCSLLGRKLTKNHVSIFWKIHGDTMSPVVRKEPPADNRLFQAEGTSTEERTLHEDFPSYCNDHYM